MREIAPEFARYEHLPQPVCFCVTPGRPTASAEPWRPMTPLLQHIILGLTLALAVPLVFAAPDAGLRAAMIHNIARFVQWPPAADRAGRFDICTFGENAVTEALRALAGKAVNGVPASVRPVERDLGGCQMLYIAEERIGDMPAIADSLAADNAATLTISDAPSFLARGGMVQLVVLNDRQRFRINQELAEKAKLDINAKLLHLALPGID